MKSRLLLFIKYYIYWIVFFLLQKILFILAQYRLMGDISVVDCLQVIWHAFPLDLSVASYITALFGLLIIGSIWYNGKWLLYICHTITAILLAISVCVFVGDNGTFTVWGYHWDKSLFTFLQSPKEVLACAEWYVWIFGGIAMGGLFAICWIVYLKLIRLDKLSVIHSVVTRSWQTGAWVLITALLFLPIRGSVTVSTMNTGRVYFSTNQMLNLAAINPIFNLIESLSENTFDVEKYTYMPSTDAWALTNKLLPENRWNTSDTQDIFTTSRPNIVLVILESFSANATHAMPNLMRLANEGIYFTNAYSSSYRTDRGIVAVMSAFPGQPTSSLMTVPAKSMHLPQIGKSLTEAGYTLHFYYGGDEDFTNMRSYLIDGGFKNRVSDKDFSVQERWSKWGAPDHILFDKATQEIVHRYNHQHKEYYFDVILTLSSHEPFDVPTTDKFGNLYLNSIAYTDSCLGAFVDSLKQSQQWENTIVILSSDHGYPYPSDITSENPLRYRIPMAIIGGAVESPQKITRLCSQIDLIPTVLFEMGLDVSPYKFSKNLLDSTQIEYAFYAFNDGFALLMPKDTVVVDAKPNILIKGTNHEINNQAHALMQCVMEEINHL